MLINKRITPRVKDLRYHRGVKKGKQLYVINTVVARIT